MGCVSSKVELKDDKKKLPPPRLLASRYQRKRIAPSVLFPIILHTVSTRRRSWRDSLQTITGRKGDKIRPQTHRPGVSRHPFGYRLAGYSQEREPHERCLPDPQRERCQLPPRPPTLRKMAGNMPESMRWGRMDSHAIHCGLLPPSPRRGHSQSGGAGRDQPGARQPWRDSAESHATPKSRHGKVCHAAAKDFRHNR